MIRSHTKLTSLLLLAVFIGSAVGMGIQSVSAQSAPEAAVPEGYPSLANEDSIVDPRGQSVKEQEQLHLGRKTVLDIIQPFSWALDVKGFKVIQVNIPIDLDLTLGIDFPLNVETSYNPYDVRTATQVPFVVNVDNKGCTPTATVGIDFLMEMSKLNFNIAELGNILNFAVDWDDIAYSQSITIPFYGVETKFGEWLSYDILDKYYTLEDIIGVSLQTDNIGITGGIGVNINYRINSWVSAKAQVTGTDGDNAVNLRWDATGNQIVPIDVDSNLTHGDYFRVEVGDWVYHIEHSVTFTIWADVGLNVLGLNLIDETFDWSYKLGLGELKFPEMNDYSFVSYPEVLAGKSKLDQSADFNLINFAYSGNTGGQVGAVGYNVDIPTNVELQKWLNKMSVDAGISASVDVKFPFAMRSYYNEYKATAGNWVDYHVLVDSMSINENPAITYDVDAFIDLKNVSIFGMQLDRYDLSFNGDIFKANGWKTPFGKSTYEYEVTSLVKLDLASKKLNDYISSVAYGINPDIQFRAWAVLECEGYLTGDIAITNGKGQILETTEFKWDSQFDTATARILINETALDTDVVGISITNVKYNLNIKPGIKLGASVLGGIVGFDYTFLLPIDFDLNIFNAQNFDDVIDIQSYGIGVSNEVVTDAVVPSGDFSVSGSFDLKNTGTKADTFAIALDASKLPAGSSATFSSTSIALAQGQTQHVTWTVNLGANAHTADMFNDLIGIKIKSGMDADVVKAISYKLTLQPDPSYVKTEVKMESDLDITPGVGVMVPVKVINKGQIAQTYSLALSGAAASFASWETTNTLSVNAGQTGILNVLVNVPAVSTNVPGVKLLTVTATSTVISENANMNVNILPFVAPDLNLNVDVAAGTTVAVGDSSTFTFNLKNTGNVNDNVKVSLQTESDCSYKLNNVAGNYSTTVAAGNTMALAAQVEFAKPGYHTYTIKAENDKGVFFTQDFNIFVKQVSVGCSADNYNYEDAPIEYTISVTNLGAAGDSFKISIDGLDASAYTIDGNASNWFFLAPSSARTFKMVYNPTDITKIPAGPNGFRVGVESQAFDFVDDTKYSAVMMKEVVSFKLPKANIVKVNSEKYYDMTFKIVNEGNINENFSVVVDGVEGLYYEVVTEDVIPTAVGSQYFVVKRGESKDITVRIYKTVDGNFLPTLKIINSKGEVIQSIKGSFTSGDVIPIWGIVLLAVGGASVAIGAAFALIVRRNNAIMGYEGQSIKERLSDMKDSIKEKFASRSDQSVRSEPKLDVETPTTVEEKGKVTQWKEERKEIDRLSKNKSFWDNDSTDGWN